jgi:phosphatidylglycerol lysyltransferase
VPLSTFFVIYLMAQITGMVSFVPAGLAVFESLFLLLLGPYIPTPEVMAAVVGSLLVYRAVYYVVPFVIGALVLGTHEAFRRREVSP